MKVYELQKTGGSDSWVRTERPEPKPGPGQALVRIRAVSLNYRDLLIARGKYGAGSSPKLPLIPTSDGAGEVVAVGPGVTRVKVGDRVAPTFFQTWTEGPMTQRPPALGGNIDGVLAEYVALDAEGLVHLPPGYSFEEGATLPCAGVTAWNALVPQGGLQKGQTVLAEGTGGVSIFALQFAHMLGARVIITSSHDEKLERTRKLGAAGTVNYKKHPDWEKQVLEFTGGQGVDHVIEVGGLDTLPQSARAARTGAHVALIGLLSGAWGKPDASLEPKQLRIQDIYVGSRAMFEDMNRAIAEHRMKPVIDRVFPFAQAPDALRYLEQGAHFGKVVISV